MKKTYLKHQKSSHFIFLLNTLFYVVLFMLIRLYILVPTISNSTFIFNTEVYENIYNLGVIVYENDIYFAIITFIIYCLLTIIYLKVLRNDIYLFFLSLFTLIIGYLLSYFLLNTIVTGTLTNYLLPIFGLPGRFYAIVILILTYFIITVLGLLLKEKDD